jgi:hypothetical protein
VSGSQIVPMAVDQDAFGSLVSYVHRIKPLFGLSHHFSTLPRPMQGIRRTECESRYCTSIHFEWTVESTI